MKFTKLLAAALLSTAMVPAVRVMPAQALLPAGETSATDKAAAGKAAEKAENAAATAGQTAGGPAPKYRFNKRERGLKRKGQQFKRTTG